MSNDPIQSIHEALDVLGLPPFVTYKEIKERYRQLSKRHHPDRGGSGEEMTKINEAFEILRQYIENYRFSFSEEEILRQFPFREHQKKFRF